MKKIALCLSIGLILFAVGCGNKIKLGGKVSYSDDGSPLEAGTVCFTSDSHDVRGTLLSDGTYTLGSLKEKDGIPPGTYRVYVFDAVEEISGGGSDGMAVRKPLIDEKFTNPSTSGLVVKVDGTTKRYDFQVDRRP